MLDRDPVDGCRLENRGLTPRGVIIANFHREPLHTGSASLQKGDPRGRRLRSGGADVAGFPAEICSGLLRAAMDKIKVRV